MSERAWRDWTRIKSAPGPRFQRGSLIAEASCSPRAFDRSQSPLQRTSQCEAPAISGRLKERAAKRSLLPAQVRVRSYAQERNGGRYRNASRESRVQ
jgi:hypothetical protein